MVTNSVRRPLLAPVRRLHRGKIPTAAASGRILCPGWRQKCPFCQIEGVLGRQTEVERDNKIERETRYHLCSIALCALTFARAVRAHWGVENRLHWVLDVVFREDLVR